MRLLYIALQLTRRRPDPFSETERGEEEEREEGATSIVDLCVHRPKSDLLRSVRKGRGGGGGWSNGCG